MTPICHMTPSGHFFFFFLFVVTLFMSAAASDHDTDPLIY